MYDIKVTVMHEVPAIAPDLPDLPDALRPRSEQTFRAASPDFSADPLKPRTVEPARRAMLEDCLKQRIKSMSNAYARHARWQTMAHRYSKAREQGGMAELDIRKMPSKNSKYGMYDDAAMTRQLMTDLGYAGVPGRPHSLWAIGEIVKYARTQTGMRTLVL